MTRTGPDPGARPVAIWHQGPGGPARATALTDQCRDLRRTALARLIARHVLHDPQASVVIDHVVLLPAATGILPADQQPLAPDPAAPEDVDEQEAPAVADPASGAVRVMARRCDSCIYRRTTRRVLGASVPALIADARARGGFVVCHESSARRGDDGWTPGAICAGYAAAHPDALALRVARAIGHIEHVDPPGGPTT